MLKQPKAFLRIADTSQLRLDFPAASEFPMFSVRRTCAYLPMLFAVLFVASCSDGPDATVQRFYRALGAGNPKAAKAEISAQFLGMLPEAKFNAMLAQLAADFEKCGGLKNVEVTLDPANSDLVRRGTATVTFAGQCPAKTEKVKLVKEGGRWKLGADK